MDTKDTKDTSDALIVRNFPSDLKQRAKIAAIARGVPFKVFVAEALEHALAVSSDTKPAIAKLREEIPDLKTASELPRRNVLDRLPVVGEQHKAKPGALTCKHGTQKGYRCWQCGGLAHVGD